ncbi:hypothetical protein KEH57_08040 [Burkholderia cenocepacia]|uniref:hypothetical protein n=1 Tax=Burkholderia cenocepacia TaxID=95486 RepID=UPI001BAB9016|nr:hypothetical protein [Burkholderia cenocepacia]QUO26848.1 hypothetical protein KEH57_08040 [Burkholderia cenocepacia]
MRNPTASSDQAKTWIQQQVQTNFVYDPVNKVDLQVPPNQANDQTQEAVTAFLEKARDKYGEDVSPGLIYGKDGKYALSAFINGAPVHKLEDVTFDQIIKQHSYSKLLSPDERGAMAALKQKLGNGTATSQDLIDNSELLAKATNLNQISDVTRGQIMKVRDGAFTGALGNVFNFPHHAHLFRWSLGLSPDWSGLEDADQTGRPVSWFRKLVGFVDRDGRGPGAQGNA